jgi:methylmalonyl-CoA/ethylmalonyl-CoA epimerase
MDKLDSSVVIQIGLIVKDVLKSAHYYAEVFGIPEPEVVPIASDAFTNTNVRGKASTARGKAAFFHLGTVEMELIEPVGGPSTWNEFLQTHGEGIHHLAIKTAEMAGAKTFLASKGMETVQEGGWDGGQYAYVDCTKQLGLILELLHFDR